MAVATLHTFKTETGRLEDHMAASMEGLEHLHRLGMQAALLNCTYGSDIGSMTTVINYANNADHAASTQKILADEGWQEFWMRAAAGGSAMPVEAAVMQDVDASYQPPEDRPFGVILATQWRAHPGRLMDFMGHVMESVPHIERMGGAVRVMQSLLGTHPMTTLVSTTFADMDSYGAYADATAGDAAWQEFWAGVMSDPTADLVRSGVYVNMSG